MWICPTEYQGDETITVAHGGGGRLMHELLADIIGPILDDEELCKSDDAAVIPQVSGALALTTDSFVVQPLFFPGGDIGSLAIHGTINDLAMRGARPLYITVGSIIEEGLPRNTLLSIFRSLASAARESGVRVVAGDTKVVERGRGDKLFLNTTGVGVVETELPITPTRIAPGDRIIISGDIGRHAIAVMAARASLNFREPVLSDSTPLWATVRTLLDTGSDIHAMRDITRGGLAAVLNECSQMARCDITLEEDAIPITPAVRHASELLGLDPLHLACEGRFIVAVSEADSESVLEVLKTITPENGPSIIGIVNPTVGDGETPTKPRRNRVIMRTPFGGARYVGIPTGEVLPRIC
jgi:hydrogenase expression/formation protein HypE